jgi:hypothetical protein
MGIIAFQFIYSGSISLLYHILLFLANASLIILYFVGDNFIQRLPFQFIKDLGDAVVSKKLRFRLLALSMLRYIVFVWQFVLALMVFDVSFSAQLILWVMLMFGAITLSPSLFMGKLIVRETVAITILSLAGIPIPAILLAAFTTWLLNQILPALLATMLVKKNNPHAWV